MNDLTSANDTKLAACFRLALELDDDAEVRSLQYQGIESWDSVGHMVLVANLEESFDVMLDTDDVIDMSSFAAARSILTKYDVAFD